MQGNIKRRLHRPRVPRGLSCFYRGCGLPVSCVCIFPMRRHVEAHAMGPAHSPAPRPLHIIPYHQSQACAARFLQPCPWSIGWRPGFGFFNDRGAWSVSRVCKAVCYSSYFIVHTTLPHTGHCPAHRAHIGIAAYSVDGTGGRRSAAASQ